MASISRILFFVTLVFSSVEQAFSQTTDKTTKAKKILDLTSNINGFRSSDKMVDSIAKFAEKDPSKKILKDPAVATQIKSEIDGAYITEMTQKLNDQELDYLITLYSSPMFQKYIKLERDFWNNRSNKILNDKISVYQKSAPKNK